MKTVGVLGGFGPETTAKFYTSIVEKNRRLAKIHPSILIHNVPVPFGLERDAVRDGKNLEKFLPLLLNGLKLLDGKSDFIVLPCNTLHIFIDDLRNASSVPVVSIVDEIAKEITARNIRKVGILATSTTSKEGLIDSSLQEIGVEVIKLGDSDQSKLSKIIFMALKGKKLKKMKNELKRLVRKMKDAGAEAVILGCTDLQLILKQEDSPICLLDTMEILANSVTKLINE